MKQLKDKYLKAQEPELGSFVFCPIEDVPYVLYRQLNGDMGREAALKTKSSDGLSGVEANGTQKNARVQGLSKVVSSKWIYLSSLTWGVVVQSPEPAAHGSKVWAFRIKCGFLGEKTGFPREKPLGAEKRTNNKLDPDENAESRNRTPVGGECCHYCTISTLKLKLAIAVLVKDFGHTLLTLFQSNFILANLLIPLDKGIVKCGSMVLEKRSGE